MGTIKKHATGKGNAKEDMLDAAKLRGFYAEDDNEVDALRRPDWAMLKD